MMYLNQIFATIKTYKNVQKYLGKYLGSIIDSFIGLNINIPKYNTLAGSSYIKLPKELTNQKSMINSQITDDDQCFKCCLVRYLHPADHNPRKIGKLKKYMETN